LLKTIVAVSIFACLLAGGASAHNADFRPAKWPSSTVLIGYSNERALQDAPRGRDAVVVGRASRLRTVAVRPSGDAASFAAEVGGRRGIDFVQAPVARRLLVGQGVAPASVPGGSYQWQYASTKSDRVPDDVRRMSVAVPIAIVDSGADLSAPDIEAKRPLMYNAIDNTRDVTDMVGHGTFVASLAAGSSSNGEGVAGVAGDARLMTIKASAAAAFTDFELAAAIAYAVDSGARVINLSLGGTGSSQIEKRALQYAFAKDVLVVAAAERGAARQPGRVPRRAPPARGLQRRRRLRPRGRRVDDLRSARAVLEPRLLRLARGARPERLRGDLEGCIAQGVAARRSAGIGEGLLRL
jgi:hypothetical protein